MFVLKNALKCIARSKARNILIGIIVLVIATSACIGLSIRQAAITANIISDLQKLWKQLFNYSAGHLFFCF